MKATGLKIAFIIALLGVLQFLILTTFAMVVYPGGTLHAPHLEHYSFFYNFFSDLGRTVTFDKQSNAFCQAIFKLTLHLSAVSMLIFFAAQTQLFRHKIAKVLSLIALILGFFAAISYIGIGTSPWNIDYWGHRFYVRIGFLSFLGMAFFYALAILFEPIYPNKYAWALFVFAIVLLLQILIMFLATNAWYSNEALFLQALTQKIVVYAQILCIAYQSIGALRLLPALYKGL